MNELSQFSGEEAKELSIITQEAFVFLMELGTKLNKTIFTSCSVWLYNVVLYCMERTYIQWCAGAGSREPIVKFSRILLAGC
jgi:hypothetical protein